MNGNPEFARKSGGPVLAGTKKAVSTENPIFFFCVVMQLMLGTDALDDSGWMENGGNGLPTMPTELKPKTQCHYKADTPHGSPFPKVSKAEAGEIHP